MLEDTDRIAELVERDAWLDMFDAAPADVREALGLANSKIAGIGPSWMPRTAYHRA